VPKIRSLPPQWSPLAKACGGETALQQALGLDAAHFYKVTRGLLKPDTVLSNLIGMLVEKMKVTSPFAPSLSATDMRLLEMIGENIQRGRFIKPRTMVTLRKTFPESELIRLAEDDSASVNVRLAVAHLLGLME
jgi:hypothetical protein